MCQHALDMHNIITLKVVELMSQMILRKRRGCVQSGGPDEVKPPSRRVVGKVMREVAVMD